MADSPRFTAQFLLDIRQNQIPIVERRFHALSHIHNVAVKHVRGTIKHLECDPFYRNLMAEQKALHGKKNLSDSEKLWKKQVNTALKQMRIDAGLSEYGLQKWIKPCAAQYSNLISSMQVQKEMTRIASAINKYFNGNGKEIHFKKYMDFDTIQGKDNKNGASFDPRTRTLNWLGLEIPCKKPKKAKTEAYLAEACTHEICFVTIKRMMFNTGWHYYAIVTFKGTPPSKGHTLGKETGGYDPGISTCNVVSDSKVFLEELAPMCKKYNEQIVDLQWKMEKSRRASNPKYYNADGTVKKGKKKWKCSNTYKKDYRKLKCLYRRKSAETKRSHNELANKILETSGTIIAEPINFPAMAKRKKQTERKEEPEVIIQKDGTVKEIHKYKRMARFGKSVSDRSPALFYKTLKGKCTALGGTWQEIKTKTYRASQYNHVTDQYTKNSLNDRKKEIDGHIVQRDLYSAFLIKHPEGDLKHADKTACEKDFSSFLKIHDETIAEMKKQGITMPQCFGF